MIGLWGVVLPSGVALSTASMAAPIYRSVDENGSVSFSDRPSPGGAVQLEPITVLPASDPRLRPGPAGAGYYSRFRVVSPENGATLSTGRSGNVQVALATAPALKPADRVQLRLDGTLSQSAMHAQVFMLSHLAEGAHVLQAELVDAGGTVRQTSAAIVFHVKHGAGAAPDLIDSDAGQRWKKHRKPSRNSP
ncbi:DUF4124 domain-containing protein [Halomonas shantousis]